MAVTFDGLWVVLVPESETETDKVPMMARAGQDLFVLAFKTGFTARQFVERAAVANAEPRMIVQKQAAQLIEQVRARGAAGVLVDYDPTTQTYKSADGWN
jgi:hypothetical protein